MSSGLTISIDTCVGDGSVALYAGDYLAYESDRLRADGKRVDIASAIDLAFREAGASPSDVSRLIATRGPGSFTGVRSGLSFARGFVRSGACDVVTCTVFDAFLSSAPEEADSCIIALFAGKREVAVKKYNRMPDGGLQQTASGFTLQPVDGFLVSLEAGKRAHISMEQRVSDLIPRNQIAEAHTAITVLVPAISVAKMAHSAVVRGEYDAGEAALSPVYTRDFTIGKS